MKRKICSSALVLLSCSAGLPYAMAADKTPVSNQEAVSSADLLNLLLEEKIINEAQLKKLLQRSQAKTRSDYGVGVQTVPAANVNDKSDVVQPGVVRVPYVPTYIKDEIRDQVRAGLREDVTNDVMAQAKTQAWGVPGAMPAWTNTIKLSGDFRFRGQGDVFGDHNQNSPPIANVNAINGKRSYLALDPDVRDLNTTEDRQRLRLRARIGLKAKVTNGIDVSTRLATGKRSDPVSTNSTLGSEFTNLEINLDRAFTRVYSFDGSQEFFAGRMENPFVSSELVWDADINFDGMAYRYYWLRSNNLMDDEQTWDPFVTAGVFSVMENSLAHDKWLLAAQTGFKRFYLGSQDVWTLALAYYHFENTTGERNTGSGNKELDYTSPDFVQFGNTLFNIASDLDAQANAVLLGLASEYHELHLTTSYDIARTAPYHVVVSADVVKNLGYDEEAVRQRLGISDSTAYDERSLGYRFGITVGWPVIAKKGDWQVGLDYRYLQRDAVLDAYTDSDFHLGGTNAKGFVLSGSYGLAPYTWLQMRYLNSSLVDATNIYGVDAEAETEYVYDVDTIQLDLNVKF